MKRIYSILVIVGVLTSGLTFLTADTTQAATTRSTYAKPRVQVKAHRRNPTIRGIFARDKRTAKAGSFTCWEENASGPDSCPEFEATCRLAYGDAAAMSSNPDGSKTCTEAGP